MHQHGGLLPQRAGPAGQPRVGDADQRGGAGDAQGQDARRCQWGGRHGGIEEGRAQGEGQCAR